MVLYSIYIYLYIIEFFTKLFLILVYLKYVNPDSDIDKTGDFSLQYRWQLDKVPTSYLILSVYI